MEDTEERHHHTRNVHDFSGLRREGSGVVDQQHLGQVTPSTAGRDPEALDTDTKSIEHLYDSIGVPPWREQLTFRALCVSVLLGSVFCVITHRLSLTVGVIPSLNVSAGLLGFFFIKLWTTAASKLGFHVKPFTRQENTVIQTCVVSCYGLAFSGGYGSWLLGMSTIGYDGLGADTPGNTIEDVKDPNLKWIFPFMFTISLLGIFVLVPLRKIMIIDYKLIYPSGTATAVLINSFHTPTGQKLANKQLHYLGKSFSFSFLWSFFKWFYSGIGGACGFDGFPTLGLVAHENRFNFDFNLTYVGAGLICPHIVNVSIMLGAIVSWGLMWPLIEKRKGNWYPADAGSSDFNGLFGYKVFISISLILGDGLYHFARVTIITCKEMYLRHQLRKQLPSMLVAAEEDFNKSSADGSPSYDEKRRKEVFMKDGVPYWVAALGYAALAIISIIVVPFIIPSIKWYYLIVAYIIAPVFSFSNAYGCGLTDWSLASNYGKIFLFAFAAWHGHGGGGIIAGLASCGVIMNIVSTGSDLMQDFKTGYLTLSSPRSMFISQLIGGVMGCVIAPSTFWLFFKAFNVGGSHSEYKAPYATIYRAMALVGVEGFGSLPGHCLQLCTAWFAFAVVVSLIRDLVPEKHLKYIPIPMAMAIPFYLGAYFAIDMFVGTVLRYIWERTDKEKADTFSPAVGSGFICGDGMWAIPSAILTFARVDPPICMVFFKAKVADALGFSN